MMFLKLFLNYYNLLNITLLFHATESDTEILLDLLPRTITE